jgi:predicted transcriptional regulator
MEGAVKLRSMSKDEFVERVRVDLVALLESDRSISLGDIAKKAGYSVVTLQHFRSGANTSCRLAERLTDIVPSIAADIRCPCCGGLPQITYR